MKARAATAKVVRCAACGQLLDDPTPPQCPLCNASLATDDMDVGADVTPYSKAYARGRSAWRSMNEWVWFAGWQRLRHLALMRSSAASRSFVRINIFLLALGLIVFEASQTGWQVVTREVAEGAEGAAAPAGAAASAPTGGGWLRLTESRTIQQPAGKTAMLRELWWNPIQSGFAAVHAFVLGLIACLIGLRLLHVGIMRAHDSSRRHERRMTAALRYSTAWVVPVALATIVAALRPIAYAGEVRQWSWSPSRHGFELSAAVLAAFGFFMWWFWLVRLGTTATGKTRGSVIFFMVVGVPLIAGIVGLGWYYSVEVISRTLFQFMNVT
ncbi:MAG: hypothetical protein IIC51_07800 [Planctomycetes bacterium]|nr:hypothetical protein [Planctomycetota bacterium]